jgi:hypothetical protein
MAGHQIARTTNSYTFATFAVADGAFVPAGLGYNGWFSNHVRFLTVITPKENPNEGKAPPNVFVVGSLPPDGTDGFLQVASWDGEVMRFYAVSTMQRATVVTLLICVSGRGKGWCRRCTSNLDLPRELLGCFQRRAYHCDDRIPWTFQRTRKWCVHHEGTAQVSNTRLHS